ncbi:hypothetical protein [Maridesulfovibrio sp. FT414]|uniref:hypothetical protein n=1 Tax=Maridesulfovibrio sp. FT414 TaxID=2979469 RepID=UPI003D80385D
MNSQRLSAAFAGVHGKEDAYEYLRTEGAVQILEKCYKTEDNEFAPQYADLARLHKAIRSRKAFTVLEFGVGYSTIIMAHALLKNKEEWDSLENKPRVRNSTMFQLHSIDAAEKWIAVTESKIPEELRPIITLHHSEVSAGLFQDRACHYYDALPDVVADFIYLDGPDPQNVKPTAYSQWDNFDKVVMSGDLLRMEPVLLPGTCILVDGRTANARFLKAHFYRNWTCERNSDSDVTVFELQEAPLGKISESTLQFCLGDRIRDWN